MPLPVIESEKGVTLLQGFSFLVLCYQLIFALVSLTISLLFLDLLFQLRFNIQYYILPLSLCCRSRTVICTPLLGVIDQNYSPELKIKVKKRKY